MSSLTAPAGMPLPVAQPKAFKPFKYGVIVLGVVFAPSLIAAVMFFCRAH